VWADGEGAPAPALRDAAPVLLEGEAAGVSAGRDGRRRDDAPLVLGLVGESVGELGFPVLDQQRPAAVTTSESGEYAVGATSRNVDLRSDGEILVLEVRRRPLRNPDHSGEGGELGRPAGETRPDGGIRALGEARVERVDVVLLRLDVERGLELLELRGIRRGNVLRLTEVVVDVVELPLEIVGRGIRPERDPREAERRGRG